MCMSACQHICKMRYTRGKMALPVAALSLPFPPVPRVDTTESLSIWCPDPLSSYFPILHTPPSLSVATWPPPPILEKGAPPYFLYPSAPAPCACIFSFTSSTNPPSIFSPMKQSKRPPWVWLKHLRCFADQMNIIFRDISAFACSFLIEE